MEKKIWHHLYIVLRYDADSLIALFDSSDKYHHKTVNFIETNKSPLITTLASITETLHLLDFNRNAQIDFMEWVHRGAVEIYNIENSDFNRLKALTEKYRDLPMDFADSWADKNSAGIFHLSKSPARSCSK